LKFPDLPEISLTATTLWRLQLCAVLWSRAFH